MHPGDSWWSIANRYGMNMYTLAARNEKTIYSMLHLGDKLTVIGQTSRTYAVRRGDTLSNIANRLGQSVYKLAQNNNITNILHKILLSIRG